MQQEHGNKIPVMVGMPFLRMVLGHKLYRLRPEEHGFAITDLDERDCILAWEYLVSLEDERD